MTTTLVLSPEREARIAALMQHDVTIRVTNDWESLQDDDPILIDATISLWDAMTNEEQEIFYGSDQIIEYTGINQCLGWMGCNSVAHTYIITTNLNDASPETSSNMCVNCHARYYYNNKFSVLKERAIYTYNYELHDMLRIEDIFPPATSVSTNCPRCSQLIPSIDSRVDHWYQPIEARINKEETAMVHARCKFECYSCATTWSYTADHEDIDGNRYCQPCFNKHNSEDEITHCSYGSHYTLGALVYSNERDDDMCQNCYDGYIECGDCGYEYHEDNGHTCEEEDNTSSYSEYIHSYSYRPRPMFWPTRFEHYYLGIELEVEVVGNESRHECASEVLRVLEDRAYLKEDGSLSNGFEIVTHPHTLYEYQTAVNWEFLKQLSGMGVRSWNRNSCGLHVHVSRTAFNQGTYAATEAHQVRFNKLIYDNQRQVERLAGRKNNHYASFNDKGKVVPKVKYGTQSSGRYSAVNMEPENTIEVRVFKGSLRKERVLSGIEFVAAAVEYTRNLKIQHKAAPFAWARFVHYVTANSDTYPNLFIIMNETFNKDNDPNGDN